MMNRRAVLKSGLTLLPPALGLSKARKRPNVVFILADDLGYGDLSAYGSEIRTPNIDSIGRQGIRFTQFYSNAPECTPTRSALMCGQYQQRFRGLECAIGIGDVGRYDEANWLQETGRVGITTRGYHDAAHSEE